MIGICGRYIQNKCKKKKKSFTLFDTCNFGAVLRAVFGFATKLVDLVNIFRKFCLELFFFIYFFMRVNLISKIDFNSLN